MIEELNPNGQVSKPTVQKSTIQQVPRKILLLKLNKFHEIKENRQKSGEILENSFFLEKTFFQRNVIIM